MRGFSPLGSISLLLLASSLVGLRNWCDGVIDLLDIFAVVRDLVFSYPVTM